MWKSFLEGEYRYFEGKYRSFNGNCVLCPVWFIAYPEKSENFIQPLKFNNLDLR